MIDPSGIEIVFPFSASRRYFLGQVVVIRWLVGDIKMPIGRSFNNRIIGSARGFDNRILGNRRRVYNTSRAKWPTLFKLEIDCVKPCLIRFKELQTGTGFLPRRRDYGFRGQDLGFW
jgi:hypothetical protein